MGMDVKRFYLGIVCLITVFILGTSPLVAVQLSSPTFQWKCQIGDKYSWQITKLRSYNSIVSVEAFEGLNVTEGDIIELTILNLREPNETASNPMRWTTIKVKNSENEVQVTDMMPVFDFRWSIDSFIFPVADGEYYVNLTQNDEHFKLQGNLLIESREFYFLTLPPIQVTTISTKDIQSGLLISYYWNLTPGFLNETSTPDHELEYNYFEDYGPFLLNVVLLGICGAEIVTIVLLLVLIKKSRNSHCQIVRQQDNLKMKHYLETIAEIIMQVDKRGM
ncbi:MAG: hypothetical protein ACFFC7_09325 [Candidatus Hermodarchaeota archaeon]